MSQLEEVLTLNTEHKKKKKINYLKSDVYTTNLDKRHKEQFHIYGQFQR